MRITCALILLATITITGCNTNTSASNKPIKENEAPDLIVKNAVEQRPYLTSLIGKGTMRITDKQNNFGLKVNAEVIAEETDRLRIKADKLAGAIQAFDVVMLKEDIGFYVPMQKTLYHGKVDELDNFAFNFAPDDVLRQLLHPDLALILKNWEVVDSTNNDPKNTLALEEKNPQDRPHLRITINKKNGMLASINQINSRNEVVEIKTFADYRTINMGKKYDKEAKQLVFPYHMAISWPKQQKQMEINFRTIEGDPIIFDEDFDLATSDDTNYRPLKEVRIENDDNDPLDMSYNK